MYRIVLACHGVPAAEGEQAATDIQREFNEFRSPRYANATCRFENGKLLLTCDNVGWDPQGLNLRDEFSDCLSAYIATAFDGDIELISATIL
jgi:hypothetical protein